MCVCAWMCVFILVGWAGKSVLVFCFLLRSENGSCNKTKTFGPMPTRNGTALSMFMRMDRSFLSLSQMVRLLKSAKLEHRIAIDANKKNRQTNKQTNNSFFMHPSTNAHPQIHPYASFWLDLMMLPYTFQCATESTRTFPMRKNKNKNSQKN